MNRRLDEAARSPGERRLFAGLLRRAYEDALELEFLYHDAEKVAAGNVGAEADFVRGLEELPPPRKADEPRPAGESQRPSGRRKAGAMVKPSRIEQIARAVARVTNGDWDRYEFYLARIRQAWERTEPLEEIYGLAREGRGEDRDRLAERLRLWSRGLYGGRGIDRPEREDRPRRVPHDGRPWPEDGPNPDWPPARPAKGEGYADPFFDWRRHELRKLDPEGFQYTIHLRYEVWSHTITGLLPASACMGSELKILGADLGDSQPETVMVVFGTLEAEVVAWSDTEITVTVPDGADSCFVGFLDRSLIFALTGSHAEGKGDPPLWKQRLREITKQGRIDHEFIATPPPDSGSNHFQGTAPEIDFFRVNGWMDLTVGPGDSLELTWEARNFDTLTIQRTTPGGPPVNLTDTDATSLDLGPFTEQEPTEAAYEIHAVNPCGEVTLEVQARLLKSPALEIVGVEVTQVIQNFDLFGFNPSNDVRLVAGKRTIARVYVDSGMRNGFNNAGPGGGPDQQGRVSGCLLLAKSPTELFLVEENLNFGHMDEPSTFVARDIWDIDRDDFDHSLNFELPLEALDGEMTIEAEVWVEEHRHDGYGYTDRNTDTVVTFESRPQRALVAVRVEAAHHGLPAPGPGEYASAILGAKKRLPIAEDGFTIRTAPGYETWTTNRDLTTHSGWEDLIDDLEEIADDFEDRKEIWTMLVPAVPGARHTGIATDGVIDWWWDEHRRMVGTAGLPASFAHELCHTVGSGHAPAPEPPHSPGDLEPGLPGYTESAGMVVPEAFVIPSGTSVLMGYQKPKTWAEATFQDRWPSIVHYERLWTRLFR